MMRLIMVELLAFGVAAGCGRSPSPRVSARGGGANNLGQTEAVALASRLSVGMKEEAADTLLREHGLSSGISLGCSHGWARFYMLSNGCNLGLEIRPDRANPSGAWTGGRLRAATIQSNGALCRLLWGWAGGSAYRGVGPFRGRGGCRGWIADRDRPGPVA